MTGNKNGSNPALSVAKDAKGTSNEPIVLPGGARINIMPVSATLLDEVSSRVVDPSPPMVYIESKDREEPNPLDPMYIKELERNERRRNVAAMDIMAMFGIELVDGVPNDDRWLRKLQFAEKRGHIDLSDYDLEDEFDLEFLYKRFIILSAKLLNQIGTASGLNAEEVAKAEETFQSN